ncbi:poly A polymerase-like protein [Oleiphilus messinensis]|uniref:Poly A polymerase-like protein n=1 Tax=Oleiphilus messinensis TaxID=141451 RepID=A0A1Y0I3M3_9GAMM|nr:AAA family ATPase [Oleiphilus messinensis]ARU54125.1 poly A polymerase-like protein [Oleiphilus messinensis]
MNRQSWLQSLTLDGTPSIDECIEQLGETFPLLLQFKVTEQDPQWHGEGDVHIHTGMVLDELYQLLEGEACHIQGERRQALVLGTLLHDIAKPLTTRRKEVRGTERVIATRHEVMGRSYIAHRLLDLELSREVVDLVMGLVGEHQMPKLLVIKKMERGEYWKLARKAPMDLLYWLEVADMRGRICEDLNEQLDLLEQFRLFCEEYDVWESHKPLELLRRNIDPHLQGLPSRTKDMIFARTMRDFEEGDISTLEEGIARTYYLREGFSEVYVLYGPSGSGKSSWIKQFDPECSVISLDELREELNGGRADQSNIGQILNVARERLKVHLRAKRNVIWDATNLREDFRQRICRIAFDYHAFVTMVVFHKSEQQIFMDNKHRPHPVPEEVLRNQLDQLEWPVPEESHRYWVIDGNGELIKWSGDFQMGGCDGVR